MICAVRTVLQRRLAAILALVVIVGGVATLVVINVVKGLPWSVNFSAVATLIVTVIVAAVAPVRSLVARAKGTLSLGDTTLAKAPRGPGEGDGRRVGRGRPAAPHQ
jgi:hypothetical protein